MAGICIEVVVGCDWPGVLVVNGMVLFSDLG